ncbi:MAG: RNA polymerase sigma factor [Acidimicrobiales bacterium]
MRSGTDLDSALEAARRGDQHGFAVLHRELVASVTRFAHARRVEDPEALTNEVFVAVFGGLDRFVGTSDDFRGWLFTIARNKVIDDSRRRRRRPRPSGVEPDPGMPAAVGTEAQVFARLGSEWVDDTLADLTEDQREVLQLRIVADLTVSETARVLDKPVGAVKALQRRALAALRRGISSDPYPFFDDRR